jgi:5-formyltetrahydrofolate cyclo-ligase
VIAAYVPVGTEPGGADLPEALAAHARVLLPILLPDGDLDWVRYEGPSSLVAAPRGLREPTGSRLGPDAITTASLILVPALAVDHNGARLGKGGGSYDRALARLAPPTAPDRRATPASPHRFASPAGLAAPRSSDISDLSVASSHRRLVVALLYDGEFVDVVPAEPHDRPVDAVITPRGGFTLSRAAEWTK